MRPTPPQPATSSCILFFRAAQATFFLHLRMTSGPSFAAAAGAQLAMARFAKGALRRLRSVFRVASVYAL
jgi:hypothetical protein